MRQLTVSILLLAFTLSLIGSIPHANAVLSITSDTTAQANCTNSTHACSVTGITTGNRNDLIIVFQDTHLDNGCTLSNFNVTDSQGLTWTQRGWAWNLTANTPQVIEWWAQSPVELSSDNITEYIHSGGGCTVNQYNGISLWAFSGNQLTFDPGGATTGISMATSPKENVTGTIYPTKTGVDQITIGAVAHSNTAVDYGSCCTGVIGKGTQQGVEYLLSTRFPSYIMTFSSNALDSWALVLDTIYSAASSGGTVPAGGCYSTNGLACQPFQTGTVNSFLGPITLPIQLLNAFVFQGVLVVSAAIVISSMIPNAQIPILSERRRRKARQSSLI